MPRSARAHYAMTVITSRQHPIVKEFRDLARGGGPSMLLDGWHLLDRGRWPRGVAIETIAICGPPTGDGTDHRSIARGAPARRSSRCRARVLNALSPVNSPTGVVAPARAARRSTPHAVLTAGARARARSASASRIPATPARSFASAAAAGATGVVLDEASADPWGWKALRASMGSAFHLPVIRSRARR